MPPERAKRVVWEWKHEPILRKGIEQLNKAKTLEEVGKASKILAEGFKVAKFELAQKAMELSKEQAAIMALERNLRKAGKHEDAKKVREIVESYDLILRELKKVGVHCDEVHFALAGIPEEKIREANKKLREVLKRLRELGEK